MVVEDLAKTVLDELHDLVKTKTVIGDPIEIKDVTIIPVSKVSIGFAAGGGSSEEQKKGTGKGTGGGASIEPLGFIVVSTGGVKLLTFKKKDSELQKLLKYIPDVMSLFKKSQKEEGKQKGKDKKTEA